MDLYYTLFNNSSNVHKVNEDGKQYLVLEDNNRDLYWGKIAYEDLCN